MKQTAIKFLLPMLLAISVISCSKDNDEPSPTVKTIEGLWVGTYQTDQVTHAATFGSFSFLPDHTLIYKAKAVTPGAEDIYAAGNWQVAGTKLTFTMSTVVYSTEVDQQGSFTWDEKAGTLTEGKWSNVTPDNGILYTGTYQSMTEVK